MMKRTDLQPAPADASSTLNGAHLTREDAAAMLRTIRSARRNNLATDAIDELIDWTASLMPHCRAAQRLKARRLLEQCSYQEADAFIGMALLRFPNDAEMLMLRARSQFEQGDWATASAAIDRVLLTRSGNRSTIILAAYIYARANRVRDAVELLTPARWRFPNDPELCALLAEAHLRNDQPAKAVRLLENLPTPPALLLAEALAKADRSLEAIDLLTNCLSEDCEANEYDATLELLIGLLETTGSGPTLCEAISQTSPETPRARLAAAEALLRYGDFAKSLGMALAICRTAATASATARRAASIAIVGASMLGRERLSQRLIRRLRESSGGIDARQSSRMWLRGLIGQALAAQQDSRLAGCDACRSVLQPLVASAHQTLTRGLQRTSICHTERAEIHRMLTICEAALGNQKAMLIALHRSHQPGSMSDPAPVGRIMPETVNPPHRTAA